MSALTFDAVGMTVLFAGDLGPVPDQEAGKAGEFVVGLRNDLDDQLLGDELASGALLVKTVCLIEFKDHASGVRRVRGLKDLQGAFLGFFDVGTNLVIVSCHDGCLSSQR